MLLEKDPLNVIITGVGGQGNVLASQMLGQMLVQKGYVVTIGETYGASQRGGSVMSHLRVSHKDQFSPLIPQGQCDIVVGLEPVEALRVLGPFGNPGVLVLVNTRPVHPIDVISGESSYPELSLILEKLKGFSRRVWTLNATEIALEMGDPIFSNIVMLGALTVLDALPIDRELFRNVLEQTLPAHKTETNMAAFDRGQQTVQELAP
jgi:indolepyruvate ferredoxin oxidoreductase beta subunit